MPHKSKR